MQPSTAFRKRARGLIGALSLALALAAVPAPAPAQAPAAYVLGPSDQVEVSIYGQPDKGVRTRIKPDGTITLPLVGTVQAAGRDVSSLATEIEQRIKSGGFINNPIVNVEIVGYVSRMVTVLGAVANPGMYPLEVPQTLATIVARAGGIRDGGSDTIVLRRARGNAVERISMAAAAQDASRDVPLHPGDSVFVGPAEIYYIYGQVASPGAYPIRAGMTLRQALARGGGPTLAGTERRVQVYRNRKDKADADLESEIQPDDVLFVRERTF